MQIKLRPNNFKEFIGQTRLKKTLNVMIESAKKRKKIVDHILLYGKAGFGKTSLATVIASENQSKIHFVQGPLLIKKSDILTLLGSITKGDVIFIDEIHGINSYVEELLYSAIEDFAIDITVGPEGDQRIIRIKIPEFTLIGATTKYGKVSRPLKERFGLISKLENYTLADIQTIIKQSATKLNVKINADCCKYIATFSKGNPRISNNLLKRVVDFSTVNEEEISKKLISETFNSIGLYEFGLSEIHITYLKILNDTFNNQYVSIETMSGLLHESKTTIEKEIEIDLLEQGLITKNSRGRTITNEGFKYISKYIVKMSRKR